MAERTSLSIPWLDLAINSNWWPVLLPLGYGLFRFGEYLLKRRLEKQPENEAIDQYTKLVDLQAKLQSNGTTIDSLNKLRSEMLGQEADAAMNLANRYNAVARRLVADVERIEYRSMQLPSNAKAERAELTQLELNALAARAAREADDELTAVVLELTQRLPGESAASLHHSQSLWLAYRAEESRRAGLVVEGGSMQPLLEHTTSEAMTRERIAALRGDLVGPEGVELTAQRSKTPTNLLQHIVPGVPKKRVEDFLGTPTYIHGEQWFYRYVETQVEITFADDGGLSNIVVALCEGQTYAGHNVFADKPLGQLTLADLLEADHQAKPEFFRSARTLEVFVRMRIGPAGAWTDYMFGALLVFSGAGHLHPTHFEWDDTTGSLLTDPKDILINWVSVPASWLEAPSFNWFIEA
ncbi:MAG TPA: lysozyme inhibitor LprI family protein [Ottowia sp.]|uniref:lysozyme inhibitor LprI family protein n=2 Tax=Ottowia sp. TaxID=1898956 RepID=UPI001D384405|nr:lysozyme inhibitor LprI family protein [Ottowia sp.]MCB0184531.1 DUF1311 domain-containing protein [Caldilineaceae bacterium]MCP5256446.1 DUF1311 domain-containing protein [Burkholderiaceae bacterium]MCB2025178.1 DUF1311 domain-containing protein [Ottowia sp.]MCB2032365.1 DUF1311 domain-containing protein [Ottowia sp.]HPK31715.1 lysozyme inhibitor LprI family protein [Ottowia sp.]